MTNVLGVHYLLELKECDPRILDNLDEVKRVLLDAARIGQTTNIETIFRKLPSLGVSGVLVSNESHIVIHTWPEHGYSAVDIFTIGNIDVLSTVGFMIESFHSSNPSFVLLNRGLIPAEFQDLQDQIGYPPLPHQIHPNETAGRFFIDFINPSSASLVKARNLLFTAKSPYQEITILETESFGKILMIDGKLQSTQADEFVYHEALVHPVMFAHPDPKKVLIIGGGEGATLREVLRNNCVKRAVMVDIDSQVVEASRRYLPEWSQGAFDDPRSEVIIEDARSYLTGTRERFDVIIMDITEPYDFSPSASLVTQEMFGVLKAHLEPGGIVVNQSGSAGITELELMSSIYHTMKSQFQFVAPYTIQITSFATPWGFVIASDEINVVAIPRETLDIRFKSRFDTQVLRYYEPKIHAALFTLPRYMTQALKSQGEVILNHAPPTFHSHKYASSNRPKGRNE